MSGFEGLPQGALNLLLAGLDQAQRDLEESPQGSATAWTHTVCQAPGVWQNVDREGSWELAGRSDSERVEGHERGKCFSVELLDVKQGLWASKRELWLGSQFQGPETFPSQKLPDP